MSKTAETAAIEAVLDTVRRGLHERDAAAIAAQFSPDAVIFDLAPPLMHAVDVEGLAAWLATWDGPVNQETGDLTIEVSGDLAVCHGLGKVAATMGGEQAEWWQRMTVCLRRRGGAWKIIHEHTSVPFYMDGSFRAATDLQP